jgi:hypothetical protein
MGMTFGGLAERENVVIKTTRNERVIGRDGKFARV